MTDEPNTNEETADESAEAEQTEDAVMRPDGFTGHGTPTASE
jgi:hypothetical protein